MLKAKEKRKDTHLNVEFLRIARRDKKAFLGDQCKEIEENNRIGKTRDLFKSHVLQYFVFSLCPDTVYCDPHNQRLWHCQ